MTDVVMLHCVCVTEVWQVSAGGFVSTMVNVLEH